MKTIFILLLIFCVFTSPYGRESSKSLGLKDRLKVVQQTQQQLLQKDGQQLEESPIVDEKKYAELTSVESPRRVIGDRITRLEVQQQYIQRDLDKAIESLQETREILIEVVSTLEKANKVTEVQVDKSMRVDTILNIIMAIVGFLVTGGGGYFAWRNKHIVFKPKTTAVQEEVKA
jgi:CII-binding regulator of phage lambda lysogenization HflD